MTFEEYLVSKKINAGAFRSGEASRFVEWQQLFEQVHPDSFTAQKKFLLNDVRRRYLLR